MWFSIPQSGLADARTSLHIIWFGFISWPHVWTADSCRLQVVLHHSHKWYLRISAWVVLHSYIYKFMWQKVQGLDEHLSYLQCGCLLYQFGWLLLQHPVMLLVLKQTTQLTFRREFSWNQSSIRIQWGRPNCFCCRWLNDLSTSQIRATSQLTILHWGQSRVQWLYIFSSFYSFRMVKVELRSKQLECEKR